MAQVVHNEPHPDPLALASSHFSARSNLNSSTPSHYPYPVIPNFPVLSPNLGPNPVPRDRPQNPSNYSRPANMSPPQTSAPVSYRPARHPSSSHTPPNGSIPPSDTPSALLNSTPDNVSPHSDIQEPTVYPSSDDISRSNPTPAMGIINSFADMALAAPIPFAAPMPMMHMQPHVMPLVPPQPVPQIPPAQHQLPGVVPNQRTTACHWVPQDRVGAVIGSHGTVIRNLQLKSGATIQVHNETVRGDLKLFTIYGHPTQIETAVQLIDQVVGRTRPTQLSTSDRPPQFLPPILRPSDLFRTMFVPTSCVGLVIGRNGDTIRNLQDRSGADIKVTPDQHVRPGQPNRPIQLTGTEQAIAMAQRLISDIVMDASRRSPHPSPTVGTHINGELVILAVVHVPNEKVGLIIGRNGVAIRDLQARSGAKIQVTKDGNCVQPDGTRPVMVTGTRSQVEEARKLIAAKINAQYLPCNEIVNGSGISGVPSNTGASGSSNAGILSGAVGANEAGSGNGIEEGPSNTAPYTPFGYAGSGYDQELGSGQQPFQPVYNGHETMGHGRPPMPYMQYVGFNNYPPGVSAHGRQVPPTIPLGYGGLQQPQQLLQPQHDFPSSVREEKAPVSQRPQQYPQNSVDHIAGGDRVGLGGTETDGSFEPQYSDGNGKIMFGAYDGNAMFGSSNMQSHMFGRDDRTNRISPEDSHAALTLAKSGSVHSAPQDNSSVSPSGSSAVLGSERQESITGNVDSRHNMQDGEVTSVPATRKFSEVSSKG